MWYTIIEAAPMLGIKVRTVREWIRMGKIQARKGAKGKWYISEEEINGHKNGKYS